MPSARYQGAIPTSRVIRSRSHVMVRSVPKYTAPTKPKKFAVEFSLTQAEQNRRVEALRILLGYSN